ncbi:hypothetical protein NUACC21_54060 [Scytonema sp. NUACC21]
MKSLADLRGGSFIGATFNKADLTQANLSGGDVSLADFREAKLDGVNWDDTLVKDALFDPGV